MSDSEDIGHMKLLLWLLVHWSEVVLITVTLCSEVSQLWICAIFNGFRIVATTTKYSHITPVRQALHWLLTKYHSTFKTAMLVYKFFHRGNPKYFEPFLISRHSAYSTRLSQSDGVFLEVPHFASVFKSRKHFGLSFVYDDLE